ncbi:MAG: hypothetical protein ACXIUQ_04960 [Cecembia sp.]
MVYISDPAYGLIQYSKEEFISRWIGNNADEQTKEGITLLLEPTPAFRKMKWEDKEKRSLSFLFKYLFNYKNYEKSQKFCKPSIYLSISLKMGGVKRKF